MSEFENMDTGSEDGDDVLAAEFVLGVLDAEARSRVERRMAVEPALAARIADWQERLAELNEAYEEKAPPARVLHGIKARLFAPDTAPAAPSGLWNSLAFWRAAALAGFVLFIAVLALDRAGLPFPDQDESGRYVATLAPTQDAQEVIAFFDTARGTVRLSGAPIDLPADRVFELWFAVGDNAPVSLGLLPREGTLEVSLAETRMAQLMAEADQPAAHFGISSEPLGGSPTGAPTGPVLVVGDLRPI